MPYRIHLRLRLSPLQADCFLALVTCFIGVTAPMLGPHLLGLS